MKTVTVLTLILNIENSDTVIYCALQLQYPPRMSPKKIDFLKIIFKRPRNLCICASIIRNINR